MKERVAVITGGNRGIGREICRQLAKQEVRVILTARAVDKGEAARRELQAEGCRGTVFCVGADGEGTVIEAQGIEVANLGLRT